MVTADVEKRAEVEGALSADQDILSAYSSEQGAPSAQTSPPPDSGMECCLAIYQLLQKGIAEADMPLVWPFAML